MPRGVPIRICEKCKRRYQHGDVDNHTALWTQHFDDETRVSFWLCWRSSCRAAGEDRVRRQRMVNAVEVDRKIRAALARLTSEEFLLSVYHELVDAGFPPVLVWGMLYMHLATHRQATR